MFKEVELHKLSGRQKNTLDEMFYSVVVGVITSVITKRFSQVSASIESQ